MLGGVFNPPHVGHMVCAQEALWQLGLDEVALTPVGDPGHRAIERDPGRAERLRLCEAAAEGVSWLTVSRVDVDRPGQTYTVDTLTQLRSADPEAEYAFVLGADQALRFGEWREPGRVLELAPLAVAEREGVSFKVVRDVVARFGDAERIIPFSMPRVDVSSTDIRARVAAARPYRFLVPEPVAQRIEEAGLYR